MSQPTANYVTFRHLVAGSVFHYQKKKAHKDDTNEPVKTITFAGAKGQLGYYTTDIEDEVAELRKLARNPQVQIEEETTAQAAAVPVITKELPPEVTMPAAEVQAQAVHASDPAVVSAQENLAKVLAATKNK